MKEWVKYALIAAVFIAFRDYLMKNISAKYSYVDYLVYAITISFIGIWAYVLYTDYKPKKIDQNDIYIIIIRILIVYLVVDPSIFKALKGTNNVGEVSALLNVNVVIAVIISVILLKSEVNTKSIFGMALIIGGGCMVSLS